MKIKSEYEIKQTSTEPHSPWQNSAKVNMRELKKMTVRLMSRTKTPMKLWDYCATYVVEIKSLTATDLYTLDGPTPYKTVTGNIPNIREYLHYNWYDPLWYYEEIAFPEIAKTLGRWLGVTHQVGQALCY
jgi:hypothetical protein